MREPVFTQTMLMGIVVRELDGRETEIRDEWGIGPWKAFDFNSGDTKDMRGDGQSATLSFRAPIAMDWQVQ